MATDPYDLQRFLDAQEYSYDSALSELRAGRKRSHWMWYVLPQLRGLGHSEMAWRYGLSGRPEAEAYLSHPQLGPRLIECVEAALTHKATSPVAIFGDIDARKFHSCVTLFAAVSPAGSCFHEALGQWFAGERDGNALVLR
jgi:uncharacterized protein (DUF1810 family)